MGGYKRKHGRLPENCKKEISYICCLWNHPSILFLSLSNEKKKIKKHHNFELSHWNYKFQPTWPLRTSLRLWKLHSKGLDLIRSVAALHCWISCKSHPNISASYWRSLQNAYSNCVCSGAWEYNWHATQISFLGFPHAETEPFLLVQKPHLAIIGPHRDTDYHIFTFFWDLKLKVVVSWEMYLLRRQAASGWVSQIFA